jgi:predicted nucleotidyltransferase
MTLNEVKYKIKERKADLEQNFKVKEIGIFGSYARGDQRDNLFMKRDISIYVIIEK